MTEPANLSPGDLSLPLYLGGEHDCPYLPGRQATEIYAPVRRIRAADYEAAMNRGFRRSGRLIYRPVCAGCRECVSLRVPVADFQPSRSQRRVLRKNRDVTMSVAAPTCDDAKWRMYSAYLAYQHDRATDSDSREDFERFLYESPTVTLELEFRAAERLIGVSIVDACPGGWSSVYFYFDPAEADRSLGVFSALSEIQACRDRGLPYWYAGFYIRECRRMNYKAAYRPHELLGPDGVWCREDVSG